ncbi:hypothetical protein GDO81_014815 [Engystomops pustulosus]|uniref:Ig-like domain-containing protein n=1 Tax=Engystomops pustulosus TaxID=76066 RepID=A0AAV7AF25_ENGPU|nr:hypothetical protein GDO81_014815 [Engystomops pustulosus]
MTMTCDVGSTIGEGMEYIWYKDNSPVHNGKSYTIQDAGTSDNGSYRCQTRSGEISDPVTLGVIDGWVILQTPLHVYEGDDINIRCHHYPGFPGGRTTFYKDNEVIRDWGDAEYNIKNVTRTTAGTYRCRKEVYDFSYEDEASVSVEEKDGWFRDLGSVISMKSTMFSWRILGNILVMWKLQIEE